MITQEDFDKAAKALDDFGAWVSQFPGMQLTDKAKWFDLQRTMKAVLKEGVKAEDLPLTITESNPPVIDGPDDTNVTGRARTFDRMSTADQTKLLTGQLQTLAITRSTLSGLIRQSDKTIIGLHNPTSYRQQVTHVMTKQDATVKLIISTGTEAYLLTENAQKNLEISQSKMWLAKK